METQSNKNNFLKNLLSPKQKNLLKAAQNWLTHLKAPAEKTLPLTAEEQQLLKT